MPGDAPTSGGDGRAAEELYFVMMAATMMLSSAFFPPLLLLVPGPLAALVYRRGYQAGIIAGVALALLVFWLQSASLSGGSSGIIPTDVLWTLNVSMLAWRLIIGLAGLSIGGAWREGASPTTAVLAGAAALALPPLLAFIVALVGWDVHLVDLAFSNLGRVQEQMMRQGEFSTLPPETAEQIKEWFQAAELSAAYMRVFWPGFLGTMAFVGSLASAAVGRWMLRRRTPTPEPLPPFQLWRFPWYLAFGFLIGQGAVLLNSLGVDLGAFEGVAGNIHLLFSNLFLIQGLSVIYFFLTRRPIPGVIRGIILVAAAFWLSFLVVWLGALDVWLNVRRLPVTAREGDDH